jgi:hypothetical protein
MPLHVVVGVVSKGEIPSDCPASGMAWCLSGFGVANTALSGGQDTRKDL